jgi:outer membrane cobalamin receptor
MARAGIGPDTRVMFSETIGRTCALGLLALAGAALAQERLALSTVEVRSRVENLEGVAGAASEGVVSGARLGQLPLLRPAEALELVPGLIATQHAGDGKANQYFLRGFNLDHGTDFATYVDGVPVNLTTHAHGQGYTDLNFLIPELIDSIHYRKGPYNAEDGDFASAGVARIAYARRLDSSLAQLTLGANGYARTLLAGSPVTSGGGQWLYGLELFRHDGPWQVPEDYRKVNGLLRYSEGTHEHGYALTAMAYQGRWTSTDQVPRRAVDSGAIDRYGSLDPSTGGSTRRYSLSGEWARREGERQRKAQAWLLHSELDLWSNFTYCLNDLAASGNCNTGDQFRQSEQRRAAGFAASESRVASWAGRDVVHSAGLQGRFDRIAPIGLYASRDRATLRTVREDQVSIDSLGLWAQTEVRWTPRLRSITGLRADVVGVRVDSSLGANSGVTGDQLLTPKFALIYAAAARTELYANYGHGFHSNDARGATITVDPANPGTAAEKVRPLVRTRGAEAGLRSEPLTGWQTTLALWQLELDSELLFVGDAGTTEPSRPSRRWGLEWGNRYLVSRWLALDADLAWSQARFTDGAAEGEHVPGAAGSTANLGVTVDALGPWSGALRLRYVGTRPLVEDDSVRSGDSVLLNLRIGYRLGARTQLTLDVYNLLDRRNNDIEYWYQSQLAGEGAAVNDRHLHPAEPRTLRLTLAHRF